MSKKNKLIPELRFPEFKNEGEWNYDKIDNLFHLQDGYAFSSNAFTHSKQNTKQVIRITDINNQNKNGDKVFVSEETAKVLGVEKYKVKNGDLLLSLTGAAGFNFFIWKSDDAYINQRTMKLNSKKKENDSLKVILEPLVHSKINEIGTGQNNNLSKDALKEIEFPFPNPNEQKKIAYCLSSLDEVIEEHSQRLDLLNKYKKGLIQNLFPQEGEKIPKYRFREFKKEGAWLKETVGDVYDFKVTNSFAREYLNYENGTVKNIHYGDIHTKFNTLFDITREDVPFINTDVSIEKIRNECYCNVGDIVFADASEDMNDVGKSIEIVNLNKEKLVSGLHTLLARQKEKKLAIGFGGYLFKSDWVRKQIQREAQGAKVLGISATRISNVQIAYPKNHKEQEAISLCLSSLDEVIISQTEKIKQLKQHKKGLIQGLFPKMID